MSTEDSQSYQIECEDKNTVSYEKICSTTTQLLQEKKTYGFAMDFGPDCLFERSCMVT